MKKFNGFKVFISAVAMSAMLISNAGAFYNMELLENNADPMVRRCPLYRGALVQLSPAEERIYLRSYDVFLDIDSEPPVSGNIMKIYERELKHIHACSCAVALSLGYKDVHAVQRFAKDIESSCNSRVFDHGLPPRELMIFGVNYIYCFLGNLLTDGTAEDIGTRDLYKFSGSASQYAFQFCRSIEKRALSPILEEMFNTYMTAEA